MTDLTQYDPIIEDAAKSWNLDPHLLRAVIGVESGGKSNARSSAGAYGLTQIIPSTAQTIGITDLTDPVQQIYGGAKYLSEGLDKEGTPQGALLYYHGGPGWRDAYGPESKAYVPKVQAEYMAVKQKYPAKTPIAPAAATAAPDAAPSVDDFLAKYGAAPAPAAPTTITPSAPDGGGDVSVDDFLAKYGAQPSAAAPAAATTAPDQPAPAPPSVAERIATGVSQGLHDAIDTPAEYLAKGADAVGLTGLVNRLGIGVPNAAETAAADQAGTAAFNQRFGDSSLANVARLGGQVAAVAPLMASGSGLLGAAGDAAVAAGRPVIGGAMNLLAGTTAAPGSGPVVNGLVRGASLAANGAATGAGGAALLGQDPVQGAEYGAVLGPVAGAIGGGANRLIGKAGGVDPEVAQLAQTARQKYGINITAPQMSGNSLIRFAADQSGKLPFAGGVADVGAQKVAFTKALANELGENAERVTPGVMSSAAERIGKVFNTVADNTTIKVDQPFLDRLQQIKADAAQTLTTEEQGPINRQISNLLDAALKGDGNIEGKTYQALTRTNSPLDILEGSKDNRGVFASQIRDALDDAFQRSAPPADQAALQNARYQYRVMKTMQPLVENSTDGVLSPQALLQAVKASSRKFDSANGGLAYGGGGNLGELAYIGRRFLSAQPDSSTATRELVNRAALGGGLGAGGGMAALMAHPYVAASVPLGLTGNALLNAYLRSGGLANRLIDSSLNPQTTNLLLRTAPGIPSAGVLALQNQISRQSPN